MRTTSAGSAESGPADEPSPRPRPESAIHAVQNTGPYQRKPMTIAATVATMPFIEPQKEIPKQRLSTGK